MNRPVPWPAAVALLSLAADAAAKAWARGALRDGHRITLAGGLVRFQLVLNHGAAFGLGAGYGPFIAAVSVVGVVLLALWARLAAGVVEQSGAALAAAGGIGNLADRLFRGPSVLHGAVVDWIHVWFYGPTFNLADVWLRGGILIAVAGWLWTRRSSRPLASHIHPSYLTAGLVLASGPGFAWWIRAWRWIGCTGMHQILHAARIHHDLSPAYRRTRRRYPVTPGPQAPRESRPGGGFTR
jgi:signal peptidase II